jgi:PAS domain S-box-containing protein
LAEFNTFLLSHLMNSNYPQNIIGQELKNSMQKTMHSFDNSENVIYFFDIETGKYDYMNKSIVTLTGYTMDELNKIGFKSIVIEEIKTEVKSDEPFIESATGFIVEDNSTRCLVKTRNGEMKWIENTSFIRVDSKGHRSNCIGVLKNVTPIQKQIEQLKEEKNNIEAILDIAEVVFVIIDENYKLTFINKKGCSLTGYTKDELLNRNLIELFIAEDSREELRTILKNLFTGKANSFERSEFEIITRTGEKLLINWHNFLFMDEGHNGKYIISSGQDITRSKRDAKIQQIISEILHTANSEKNLDELFKMIHSSIIKLMPARNFYISLYEKENELISFPYVVDEFDDITPPKRFGKGLTEYVLTTGKPALVTEEKDKELIESGMTEMVGTPAAVWLGVPLKIQDNTIGVMVLQDYNDPKMYGEKEQEILEVISYPISRAIERKKVEQERNELIAKLKNLNESKDKLFSLISHDLRSPFNSLLGFSEILTSEFDSLTQEEIKEYINVIYETSKNLYYMTNNLLQFSRFQMGRFDFNPAKLNLKKLILSNLNLLKGNIIKKQLNMSVDIGIDIEVFADEDMLNSIVQNLISNAIKFTHRGGDIKISERILTFFDEPSQVEIAVEDSGVGISPEDTEKIFKEHMHSSPGTEKEYGTGLGLLLVKEFVQINGGQIIVKSKPGKGTTFVFTLPVLG